MHYMVVVLISFLLNPSPYGVRMDSLLVIGRKKKNSCGTHCVYLVLSMVRSIHWPLNWTIPWSCTNAIDPPSRLESPECLVDWEWLHLYICIILLFKNSTRINGIPTLLILFHHPSSVTTSTIGFKGICWWLGYQIQTWCRLLQHCVFDQYSH